MPLYCDTRDGLVITAARTDLEAGNVNFASIWVLESAEIELNEQSKRLEEDLQQRLKRVMSWQNYDVNVVKAGREFVQSRQNCTIHLIKPPLLNLV
jgi:hypothetical protein